MKINISKKKKKGKTKFIRMKLGPNVRKIKDKGIKLKRHE
jgi:hypothetical protein